MKTRIFNVVVVMLAAFVAIATPLQYAVSLHDPAIARYFGLPMLTALPMSTLAVIVSACVIESLLMVWVVVELTRVILSFQRGLFFTAAVVTGLYRIGGTLLGIALLSIGTLGAGLITTALSSDLLAHLPWWAHVLNLPAEMLVTGCVVLLVAGAFRRARTMADEQRYTV